MRKKPQKPITITRDELDRRLAAHTFNLRYTLGRFKTWIFWSFGL